MARWTKDELAKLSNAEFILAILRERKEKMTNPDSPLGVKLTSAIKDIQRVFARQISTPGVQKDTYTYTITMISDYVGYPEAQRIYEISSMFFTMRIVWYGNHGFDIPTITKSTKNNGYFWSLRPLLEALTQGTLRNIVEGMHKGDKKTFKL